MQMKMSLLLIVFLCSPSMAGPAKKATHVQRKVSSIECTFVKWPYADKVITKENIAMLKKLDRNQVRSYYLNEITSTPVQKELAYGLYDFLISTEHNENIRAFLELTSYSSDLKTAAPKTLNQKEICELAKHVSVELPQN